MNTLTKYTGVFITFEGIDLTGKSTQIELLKNYFVKKKKKVKVVREPGGTYISEKIRDILLDKSNTGMFPLTEFFLFSASRYQLTEEVIKPLLKKNYFVLCDRYYDSSTAYQGYGGMIDLKIINKINRIASGLLKPDITFLIDLSLEATERRRLLAGKQHDRMEAKEKSYFKKVRSGYLTLSRLDKKRFFVLDGEKSVDILHSEIVNIINKKLNEKNK